MTLKEILNTLERIDALQNRLVKNSDGDIWIGSRSYHVNLSSYYYKFTTPEICLQAISRFIHMSDWDSAEYIFDCIPKKFLTQDFFVKLLDAAPDALQYMPKTQELCLLAVTKYGYALHYVPDEYKTEELCSASVKQFASVLEYVPDHLKTPELCLLAVTEDVFALQYVPDEYKTEELCSASVKQFAGVLEYVPEHLKTPELCLQAVTKDGYALQYVPEELKTRDICYTAVKNCSLDFVLLRNNGHTLKFVPTHLKTFDLCVAAVQTSNCALGYVPPEIVEQVLEAVRNTEDEK